MCLKKKKEKKSLITITKNALFNSFIVTLLPYEVNRNVCNLTIYELFKSDFMHFVTNN